MIFLMHREGISNIKPENYKVRIKAVNGMSTIVLEKFHLVQMKWLSF